MITLIVVGKVKEKNIVTLISEYEKRLSNKKIKLIEIKDSNKEKENLELMKKINLIKDSFVIALSEDGNSVSSREFSKLLKKEQDKNIVFVIGGPDGLTKELKTKSDYLLSLSKMTFTHEMARYLLYEQLYRSYSILEGKKYHRE